MSNVHKCSLCERTMTLTSEQEAAKARLEKKGYDVGLACRFVCWRDLEGIGLGAVIQGRLYP
jgi:hypothetical protein